MLLHHDIYRIYRNGLPCTSTVQFNVFKRVHGALSRSVFVDLSMVENMNPKIAFIHRHRWATQLGTRKITKNAAMIADTRKTSAIVAVGPAS